MRSLPSARCRLVSATSQKPPDSRIGFCSNHCVTGIREPAMLTAMTERDWSIVLAVFDAAQSSRGEPGHDDRKLLEAIHYFIVHSITWRALPSEFGNWNSVWKRFWRLSRLRRVRGFLPVAGGVQPDGTPGAVVRQHDSARPRHGRRGERG